METPRYKFQGKYVNGVVTIEVSVGGFVWRDFTYDKFPGYVHKDQTIRWCVGETCDLIHIKREDVDFDRSDTFGRTFVTVY